jgi:hypothetical protein
MSGTEFAGWMSSNAGRSRGAGVPGRVWRGGLTVTMVVVGLLGGLGWCYALRTEGWFAVGPRISDSLPLLQLAQFDAQPLLRVVVSWLASGAIAGLLMARVPRPTRLLLAGALGAVLLAVDAQASYALTRNLRFGSIFWTHAPGLGPWLATALFALACALPGSRRLVRRPIGTTRPIATKH